MDIRVRQRQYLKKCAVLPNSGPIILMSMELCTPICRRSSERECYLDEKEFVRRELGDLYVCHEVGFEGRQHARAHS